MDKAPVHADRSELERDLRRVADRLRTAPLARLDGARTVLGALADLALGTEARGSATAPDWRPVPDVGAVALGDQVTVLGAELSAAIMTVGDDTAIWTRTGHEPLGEALDRLAEQLRAWRLAL